MAYFGPRFYIVRYRHINSERESTETYGQRSSEARAAAQRIAASNWADNVRMETVDDHYPANVLSEETF